MLALAVVSENGWARRRERRGTGSRRGGGHDGCGRSVVGFGLVGGKGGDQLRDYALRCQLAHHRLLSLPSRSPRASPCPAAVAPPTRSQKEQALSLDGGGAPAADTPGEPKKKETVLSRQDTWLYVEGLQSSDWAKRTEAARALKVRPREKPPRDPSLASASRPPRAPLLLPSLPPLLPSQPLLLPSLPPSPRRSSPLRRLPSSRLLAPPQKKQRADSGVPSPRTSPHPAALR